MAMMADGLLARKPHESGNAGFLSLDPPHVACAGPSPPCFFFFHTPLFFCLTPLQPSFWTDACGGSTELTHSCPQPATMAAAASAPGG